MPEDEKPSTLSATRTGTANGAYPFPKETRLLLLDFMDSLLELLDRDSGISLVPVPIRRPRPRRLSRNACPGAPRGHRAPREIGPVYHRAVVFAAEEYIVNGESLVRKSGHWPSQSSCAGQGLEDRLYPLQIYGQTSQMPQIYQGSASTRSSSTGASTPPRASLSWWARRVPSLRDPFRVPEPVQLLFLCLPHAGARHEPRRMVVRLGARRVSLPPGVDTPSPVRITTSWIRTRNSGIPTSLPRQLPEKLGA